MPFVSTPVVAQGVADAIAAGTVQNLVGLFGEDGVPKAPRVPEGTLTGASATLGGVAFEFDVFDNAEAPQQLVIKLPEAGVIIIQDLLYNNARFYPGADRTNWITILDGLRKLEGYNTVLVGHGAPTTRGEFDHGIEYLTYANELVAKTNTAEDISSRLAARFPSYGGTLLLSFWAQFFLAK
ncbi:MAG TPA: hypothetical protein PLD47_01405 [Aggregatilineales bacterium]|nr:hypothetical protein [Anaerolineales bacterium]HRE46354.1 hypothetical protein [Aggregatilineales bacterium]